jgi:hypothetical protein
MWPLAGRAQSILAYFPPGVPGYDQEQGVTILSRLRPLYDDANVRVGDFVLSPTLDEGVGFNSNVVGTPSGPSSAYLETSPALTASSDWSRDRLGAAVSLNSYNYFNTPKQNVTDVSGSIGGGYTIGREDLTLAYSHQSLYESGTTIGAVPSLEPVHYQVDDARSDYTFDLGRLSLTPNLDVSQYSFDNAMILGVPTDQQYRDRVIAVGGVTARYDLGGQEGALLVAQGVDSHYLEPQPGQPSNNSKSALLLAGLEFHAAGVWRYRLLAGIEVRDFQSALYGTRVAPDIEASVIYTPTGLTTLTSTLSRTIESPESEGTGGYNYTAASLVVDHEYLRNVLLEGRASLQAAQFLQGGGTQTAYSLGAGVTWLLNRHMRLSANYDFTQQQSSGGTSASAVGLDAVAGGGAVETGTGLPTPLTSLTTGSYSQSVFLLNLHLAL